jgi:hypothetical protein
MALSDKDILITPNKGSSTDDPKIEFIGATSSSSSTITAKVYDLDGGTLSFEGTAGQLFSITNSLTSGSIFSVNDVSGIPSIDVNANGTILLAPFESTPLVGIGTSSPTVALDVVGNIATTGSLSVGTTLTVNGNTAWTSGNDGSGSGLDADLLDGQQGSYYLNYNNLSNKPTIPTNNNQLTNGAGYITSSGSITGSAGTLDGLDSTQFLRSDAADSFSGTLTGALSSGGTAINLATNDNYASMRVIRNQNTGAFADGMYIGYANGNSGYTRIFGGGATSGGITVTGSGASNVTIAGNVAWNAGNDGAGSALDADLLDGQQGSYYLNYNNLSNKPTIGNGTLTLNVSGTGLSGSTSFTANQSGNSTFTVTSNATSANTASTIVARDGSGNFSAGAITATSERLSGNLSAWNTTTPGTGLGGLHLGAASGTSNVGPAITFGARDISSGGTAQAGIYINSDGTYGTRMYLATSDNYTTGSKVAMSISESGIVNFSRATPTSGGNTIWHAGNDGSGSGLDADLLDGQQGSYYAPIASPALTGTPTAPTASAGTNTTQLATTAFVSTAVSNLVDSAPTTLDTLNELAAALGDDPNFATTITNSLATKLSTTTQFGGDVSGTYNAIVVANDSHTHDTRYYTETESDARYLGITAKAADSNLLDGIDSTSFLRSDAADTSSTTYTFTNTSINPKLDFSGHAGAANYNYFMRASNDTGVKAVHFVNGSTRTFDGGINTYTIRNDAGSLRLGRSEYSTLIEGSGDLTFNANEVWHAGNDGAGSGLDADLLDGLQESTFMRRTANSVLNMNNYNITGVGALYINDPGPYEGIIWSGGNDWRIFESPDDLTTNSGGNFQFSTGSTRRATLSTSGSLWTSAQGTLWGNSNDGSGSGLDADLWDGQQFSSYLNQAVLTTSSPTFANVYVNQWFRNYAAGRGLYNQATTGHFYSAGTSYWHITGASTSTSGGLIFYSAFNATEGNATNRKGYVYWDASGFGLLSNDGSWAYRHNNTYADIYGTIRQDGANTVWHAGNDGAGSGLDADLLDGQNLVNNAATANTVAGRDGSGDINVRLIRQTYIDQSTISGGMVFRVNNSSDNYLRVCNNTGAIRTYLNVPTRTGGNASGTWGINITGNAATATSATNAGTLDGIDSTSFLRSDAADTATGIITFNADTRYGSQSSQQGGGLAVQRVWNKSVAAGQLYQLGTWNDIEGTASILIQVSSETSGNSGTSTYLWQGGFSQLTGSYYRLYPLNVGRGHGQGADTGENTNAWQVFIYGTTVTGSAYTYGLAVHVASGANTKNLVVTATELKRGMSFTDQGSSSVITSFTNSGNIFSNRTVLAENVKIGSSFSQVWHAGNDGAGSGLDADLLDGLNANTAGANVILKTSSSGYILHDNWIRIGSGNGLYNSNGAYFYEDTTYGWFSRSRISNSSSIRLQVYNGTNVGWLYADSSLNQGFLSSGGGWRLFIPNSGNIKRDNLYGLWDSGNDGSGSGLDADLLDGQQGSYYLNYNNLSNKPTIGNGTLTLNVSGTGLSGSTSFTANQTGNATFTVTSNATSANTASTIVARNGSGNFSAGIITAALSGNATTATNISGYSGTYWTSNNDGASSGLDADLLDGQQGSYYQNASNINAGTLNDARLSYTELGRSPVGNFGQWAGHSAFSDFNTPPTYWGWTYLNGTTNAPNTSSVQWYRGRFSLGNQYGLGSDVSDYWMEMAIPRYSQGGAPGNLWIRTCENGAEQSWYQVAATVSGNTTWHAGNDGAGSGLDADLLDGQQGSYYLNYNNLSNKPTIPTNNNQLTNGAGYITSADGGNAATVDGLDSSQFLRADANDTFSGSLTGSGSAKITFGPNSTWGKYLVVGGNGYGGNANTASMVTTNGNLHLDAATSSATYLNYYAGTAGVAFGTGSTGIVAWMGPDGDLWKGGADNSGSKYWHAGNDGAGSGLDADLLDGLNSTQFLRSDAVAAASQRIQFTANSTNNWDNIATTQGNLGCIEIRNDGAGNDAFMAFHASSDFAFYFGLDASTNDLSVGGWSMGANKYRVWHAGNDGAGGGLDADLLDGQQGSYYLNYNNLSNKPTIPTNNNQLTNGAGYITSSGSITGSAGTLDGLDSTQFLRSDTSDTFTGTQLFFGSSSNWLANGEVVVGSTEITSSFIYINGNLSWHAGNDGSGSGLDADLLDGLQPSVSASNNTIVQRHSSGYIYANYFNTTPNDVTSGVTKVCVETGNDGFIRHGTAAAIRTFIGAGSGGGLDADLLDGQQGSYYLDYNNFTNTPTIPTNNNQLTNGAGYITSSGSITGSAGTLDGIDSSQFLRSDTGDTMSAMLTAYTSLTNNEDYSNSPISIRERGLAGAGDGEDRDCPNLNFHWGGRVSKSFWLSANGYMNWGEYNSSGVPQVDGTIRAGNLLVSSSNHQVWHAGNDGSGSGLDADLLDGLNAANEGTANTIARRDGSGHLTMNYGFAAYFNMSHGSTTRTADTIFYSSTDNYIRKTDATGMRSSLNVPTRTGGDASGTWGINITGNAATATSATSATSSDYLTGSAFATTGSPSSALEYQQAASITDTRLAPTTDWYNTIRMGHGNPYNYYSNTIAMQMTGTGAGQIRTQLISNNSPQGWRTVWDSSNDGSGSGLDADLLDGLNAATTGANTIVRTDGSGNIAASGNVTAYSSDRRLKENFNHIESPVEKVQKLNGYTFDWNEKSKELGFTPKHEKNDIGLIAQEVEDILPQAVAPAPFDTKSNGESKSGENYLTIQYERLVPLLVEAIKEQQNQINKLTQEINELKSN